MTVDTGNIVADARIEVVLEPANSPKLRTIGTVTVNGGYALPRDTIPAMDVTRVQMQALDYSTGLQGLEQVPSVIIQHPDAGSPGAPAVISLRGPDPSEAMVTLDGQQLNDGNTGDIDLSQFAVPAFNSINVTEGLGPTDAEGSNTFGGAVNFVSLQPTQQNHFNLSGTLGSYDTSQTWLNATGTLGKLGYALAGNNYQSFGQINQTSLVVPSNNQPIYCGPYTKTAPPPNCPAPVHLGSTISAQLGLANFDYNFSQRSDLGFRVFTLGDFRDESSAIDGIAGNATCVFPGQPGPACNFNPKGGETSAANPVFGYFSGPGSGIFQQSIRAYDTYSRSVLGAGSLLAGYYVSDNNVDFSGGAASPYDVSHADKRYNESLSWGRTFDEGEFAFGGYLRQESLAGVGIDTTLAQSIGSYFIRGAQQFGDLRLSGGLYDADYSTFGNTLNWRLGIGFDFRPESALRFSVGTGFRPPLLIERYFFPPVTVNGVLRPNPGLPPEDSNCVVPGQGNPNEQPEHATEYELGFSHLFSNWSNLDVSFYRSNLRDTIENFYPGGGAVNYCGKNGQGFAYEIPVNIGNAVYEGAEMRFKQGFPKQHLTAVLSYGLNVAYPYALGPNVSNPTSGGTLVAYQQFLGVPQQQGSATLIWAEKGWHAATAFTFAGNNNSYHQAPYTFTDAAVGKTFGHVDFTVAATNVFNSVAGRFTYLDAGIPYRGLYQNSSGMAAPGALPTNQLFVQPAAIRFTMTVHDL